MSQAVGSIAIGLGLGAVAVLTGPLGPFAVAALANVIPFIAIAGGAMVLSGIGSLLSGAGGEIPAGLQISSRNPIAPWEVIYGRKRVGGTIIYINGFGLGDKFLDLVIVLAAHKCEAVDSIYFNNTRVLINATNKTSFTPIQSRATISAIARVGGEVTVTVTGDIPLLADGDQVAVSRVAGDATLNGTFSVQIVNRTGGNLTFKYFSGGLPYSGSANFGVVDSLWPDYGAKVYFEAMLGSQTLGQTFAGMVTGTPANIGAPPHNVVVPGSFVFPPTNPWTTDCSVLGKTCVMVRLNYDATYFANGLPNISFQVRGKNDIADPRGPSVGYTENAALCIADYLATTPWGFKATLGTDIPNADLIAAANICDETVTLNTSGTEPRYSCNGSFPLTMTRASVLQNMLTSCAGRLTYVGGQFRIWPGAWFGTSGSVTNFGLPITAVSGSSIFSLATDAFRWRPYLSLSNTYNGVKGTYISPTNNWLATDFPAYAQDVLHGYSSDANLAADGGDRRWLDVQLPFTVSASMAQRIAKIELLRRRHQGTGTFTLNMAGYQFAPMDVITMDLSYLAWTGKYLEILNSRLKFNKQSGGDTEVVLLSTEIDVQETDPSIYAWSTGEELSPSGNQQATTPDNLTPAGPTNVLLSSELGAIFVTWVAPDDAFVLHGGHIEVEYQLVISPEGLWFSLAKMDPTITQATIPNLQAGDSYNVQVRAVNVAGVPSVWITGSPFDTSPPVPGPITVQNDIEPFGQWQPNQIQGNSADALYPNEWTFDLQQQYPFAASGSTLPQAVASGKQPVNLFVPNCGPVEVPPGGVTQAPTGGHIPGGVTVFIQLCAIDSLGRYSPASRVVSVDVAAGPNTNTVTLTGILWPTLGGLTGYVVFAALQQDLICGQQTGVLTGSGPYGPTSITITGPLARTSYAVPNASIAKVRLKGKRLIHGGPVGGLVYSVTSTTIVGTGTADLDTGTDNWTGRMLVIIGRLTGSIPFAAFNITGFTAATGVYTVDRDPSAIVQPGDVFVVTFLGYDNSANPLLLTDAGLSNATNIPPHTGESANDPNRIGNYVLVIQGKSRGATAKIVANTTTSYTLSSPITIDTTSVWIVVIAAWVDFAEASVSNADTSKATQITMDISNYNSLPVVIGATIVDTNGLESDETDSPIRMMFVNGAQGTREVTALTPQVSSLVPMVLVDGTVEFDTSIGGAGITIPAATDLAVALTDTVGTAVQLTSGTNTVNGTVIEVVVTASPPVSERMLIVSGGGTNNLVVQRGFGGTTAMTHLIHEVVNLPGMLPFGLLPAVQVPNVKLILTKISADINYVQYTVAAMSGDTLPGGGTSGLLIDNSSDNGTVLINFPGN